ncbi:ABC transporter permease [Ferrovibrio sp.]|uniref:ABC transporter permease n=1 Tax=Ferrovibrio sp. TaxID=1917215 RepID=UPI0025BB6F80|nr:ABC transporter permease [Ferrovibrio sp.]MBX3453611.1 ABC transporter permease [Ferrovibrio sp.]
MSAYAKADGARRKDPLYPIFAGISVIVLLWVVAPLIVTFFSAFSSTTNASFPPDGFSLRWFRNVFEIDEFKTPFYRSIALALISGICAMTLGTLSALALTKYRFRGSEAIDAVLMSPLIVPQVIIGLSFLIFVSRMQFTGKFAVLVVLHCVLTLPYAVRVIRASLTRVGRSLEEAAVGLGASPLKAFFLVTLPQIKAGIFAASFFCFVISFDNFTATAFLSQSNSTLPVEIYFYIETRVDPTISAIAALMMLGTTAFVLLIDRMVGVNRIT